MGAGVAARGVGIGARFLPYVESAIGNGALAGLEPTQGSHALNALVGAGAGAAFPLAGKALGAGARLVRNGLQYVIDPGAVADRQIVKAFGANAGPALAAAGPDAAGVTHTAAQVLKGPQAIGTEQAMRRAATGAKFANRDVQADAARVAHIQQFAGTPDTLQAAYDARDAMVKPFMAQSMNYLTPSERWGNAENIINDALNNGGRMSSADRQALRNARTVARKVQSGDMQEDDAAHEIEDATGNATSKGAVSALQNAADATTERMTSAQPVTDAMARLQLSSAGKDPVAARVLATLRGNLAADVDARGNVPLSSLEGLRANLGQTIRSEANQAGASGSRANVALTPVNDALVDVLGRNVPGFRNYLADYARLSDPINTQSTLQGFLRNVAMDDRNAGGDPLIRSKHTKALLGALENDPNGINQDAAQAVRDVHDSLLADHVSKVNVGGGASTRPLGTRIGHGMMGLLHNGNPYNGMSGLLMPGLGAAAGGAIGDKFHHPVIGAELGALAGGGMGGMIARRIVPLIGERAASAPAAAAAIQRAAQPGLLSRTVPPWIPAPSLIPAAGATALMQPQ